MDDVTGLGRTRWEANDTGGINVIPLGNMRHQREFIYKMDITNRPVVCDMLKLAYEQGRREQALLIRQTIGYGGPL